MQGEGMVKLLDEMSPETGGIGALGWAVEGGASREGWAGLGGMSLNVSLPGADSNTVEECLSNCQQLADKIFTFFGFFLLFFEILSCNGPENKTLDYIQKS